MSTAKKAKLPNKKARPVGRPTDYKKAYCKQIIAHMAKGLSLESFAGKLGVAKQTVYDWTKAHPEFLDASIIAREKCRLFYEEMGIKGMTNKISFFNDRIWRFNMINRFKDEWKERVETDLTSGGEKIQSVNIASLTATDLKQLESILSKANGV